MYSLLSDIPDAKLVEENKQLQSKLEEANATVKQEQTKVFLFLFTFFSSP